MSLTLSIALYFVIWWTVLFAVLPLDIRSQYEEGKVVPGSEGAAPAQPRLLRKMMITTLVATVTFAVVYVVVSWRLVSLDWFPGPSFKA